MTATRRSFLTALGSGCALARRSAAQTAGSQLFWTVETTSGKVQGIANSGVKEFKGIPYGAFTAGKNRFMPPVKPAKWAGVRDVLAYGPSAPQQVNANAAANPNAPPVGEDCLVLNVYTPTLNGGSKRPVMVWLHGGGFSSGSGSGATIQGANLAHGLLHLLMAEYHRAQHDLLGQSLVLRFDHQHRIGSAGDHQVKARAGLIGAGRIEQILPVAVTDASRANRAIER